MEYLEDSLIDKWVASAIRLGSEGIIIPNPMESMQMVIKINNKPLFCFSLIPQN
jgi:hypothetical protein